MAIFLKNEKNRLEFRFGRQSALRSTSDVVDQLQARVNQLEAQVAQEKLNAAEERKEKAL